MEYADRMPYSPEDRADFAEMARGASVIVGQLLTIQRNAPRIAGADYRLSEAARAAEALASNLELLAEGKHSAEFLGALRAFRAAHGLAAREAAGGERCDDCGERRESTRRRLDPFAADVYGEHVYVTICNECEHERAQDI